MFSVKSWGSYDLWMSSCLRSHSRCCSYMHDLENVCPAHLNVLWHWKHYNFQNVLEPLLLVFHWLCLPLWGPLGTSWGSVQRTSVAACVTAAACSTVHLLEGLALSSELMEACKVSRIFSHPNCLWRANSIFSRSDEESSRHQTAESVLLTGLHIASEECDRFVQQSCILHIIKDVSALVPCHFKVPYRAKGTGTSSSPSPWLVIFLNVMSYGAWAHWSVYTAAPVGAQLH